MTFISEKTLNPAGDSPLKLPMADKETFAGYANFTLHVNDNSKLTLLSTPALSCMAGKRSQTYNRHIITSVDHLKIFKNRCI